MMWKTTVTVLCGIALIAAIGGCADDAEYATIEGSLALSLGSGQTGFNFEVPVPLTAQPDDVDPGCAAGECVLSLDESGVPSSLEVWIQRGSDGEQSLGFRSLEVSLSEDSAALAASVMATRGEQTYYATGGATCSISDLSSIDTSGDVELLIDCDLVSDNDQVISATADLFISRCTIE